MKKLGRSLKEKKRDGPWMKKMGRSLKEKKRDGPWRKKGTVLEGKNWDGPEKRKKHQKINPLNELTFKRVPRENLD